jgi:hypothetical protein
MTKLRALTDMSLRMSADPKSPLYEMWYEWPAGTTFEAPENLDIDRALERGIVEKVGRRPKKGAGDGEG